MSWVLGISAYYHDSAVALLCNGEIIAAAQEERFSRIKSDSSFPAQAISYVLQEAGIQLQDLQIIAFYEKPFIKFERLLETYHAFVPKGLPSFLKAMPVWVKEKMLLKSIIRKELAKIGTFKGELLFPEHHLSHAASAFFPSPFENAAILTVDGVGEWATTTIGVGNQNKISVLKELHFPHSLGLLYSAFTYYCGFKVNSGEYKLMGLAPYGDKNDEQTLRFIDLIKSKLIDIRSDGSFLLNLSYFEFATGLRMTHDKKWKSLFGMPPRKPESEINQEYMNLGLAIQMVTEEIMLKLAATAKALTNCNYLVMAGGVALNSVANGKMMLQGLFQDIWVQPAAGDAGGALGAALATWFIYGENQRKVEHQDILKGSLLGPEFSDQQIFKFLRKQNIKNAYHQNFDELCSFVSEEIAKGKVVGWFQGKMEYGPRALGNRSILADARNPEIQQKMNFKIKKRESFRPFAPAVLADDCKDFFDLSGKSPYMLFVVPVKKERQSGQPSANVKNIMERLYFERSDIPAVTHIDYSARVQTVLKDVNPKFWQLINTFKQLTGYGLLVNTSFNVRGEPIVCSPADAYSCFQSTDMDVLVMGNYVIVKS